MILIFKYFMYWIYLYSLCFEIIGHYFIDLWIYKKAKRRVTHLDHVLKFSNWIKGSGTLLLLLRPLIEFLGDLMHFIETYYDSYKDILSWFGWIGLIQNWRRILILRWIRELQTLTIIFDYLIVFIFLI